MYGVYDCYTKNMCGRLSKVQYKNVGDKQLAWIKEKWCGKICLWLGFPAIHTTWKYVRHQYFKFLFMNNNIKLCQPVCICSLFETVVSNTVYIAMND